MQAGINQHINKLKCKYASALEVSSFIKMVHTRSYDLRYQIIYFV